MKSKFHGYYEPSTQQFNDLWENALFVFDSNVILNLYTYSDDTRAAFLKLMGEHGDRVWLPHQVAAEYHMNRCDRINSEVRNYTNCMPNLKKAHQALKAKKQQPFVKEEIFQQFEEVLQKIEIELKASKESHLELIHIDPIRDQVTDIFEGRVGDGYSEEVLNKIYDEGKKRYRNNIPPGYKDIEKPEPARYGDYVWWKQLLEHACETKQSVILVTDDNKEDWWLKANRETIGPRPELIHEFLKKTKQELYIYSSERFVEIAREQGEGISNTAVKEIEKAAEQRSQDLDRGIRSLPIDPAGKLAWDILTKNPLSDILEQQRRWDEITKNPLSDILEQQRRWDEITKYMSPNDEDDDGGSDKTE